MNALVLASLLRKIDAPPPSSDPLTWTIDGRPLHRSEIAILEGATEDDWQTIHLLAVADGRAR